ncbi:MAG: metalloprotease RseP [Pseudomonadota bacterium]|jgi:regulator of sigma E protease
MKLWASGTSRGSGLDINGLVAGFGSVGFTLVAFVVALSIIVAIHEYGHYIVGRWCGIHAEVFSLGFGPTLFSRVDKHGTRWQVAALPFGGYVKFLGDKDAASTGPDGLAMEGLSATERRRTMHGAPLWARTLTIAAGPMANFLLAILIFTGFVLWSGIATERAVIGKLQPYPFDGPTLQVGDEITAMNGVPTPDLTAFLEAADELPAAPFVSYTVQRAGETLSVPGPHPRPPLADGVMPQSAAFEAGLLTGDVIRAVDGVPIHSFTQMREIVGASDGKPLALTIWRAGETMDLTLSPRRSDLPKDGGGFETRWLIGLNGSMLFGPEVRDAGLFEALGYGGDQVWRIISSTFSGIAHIVRGDISTCNLKGPIGIAETSSAAASMGVDSFVWFIAALSTAVGLMNLFPVPVLDGGHLVFHAYEAITRRPPSERVLQVMMMTGFGLIMALMAFALSRDLFC